KLTFKKPFGEDRKSLNPFFSPNMGGKNENSPFYLLGNTGAGKKNPKTKQQRRGENPPKMPRVKQKGRKNKRFSPQKK
ncbi:hypothetical protein, partial [Caldanaerobacter subterraneus]|uniref:hypothetical protein n=1 Tax=Caldanaerobacter subterraneus TaxID=911092 RepID=UPI001B809E0C